MRVGVAEAQDRLPELIEAAARGEEVLITRPGGAAVRLVATPGRAGAQARDLARVFDDVRRRRGRLNVELSPEDVERLIADGRP